MDSTQGLEGSERLLDGLVWISRSILRKRRSEVHRSGVGGYRLQRRRLSTTFMFASHMSQMDGMMNLADI